ncbi:MAG TPA: sulfatase [Actinomycetota bacterium]|nr:sulfatase [Actinomycetota bacterium]
MPNVFFLVIDSLRADAVFGDRIATPNFDRFADRGAAFHQCIATCTTTTPSFSSILTGCYPPKHGVRGLQGYRLSPSLTTLAEAFAAGGFETHAEVTGPLLPETGVLRGFSDAHHRQAYRVPFFGWRDEVVERMRSYVDPWFMLLHIWEVHRPYRAPPDFEKRRDKAGYEAAVHATDEWLAPVFEAAGDDTIVVITGDHGEDYPGSALGFQGVRVARKLRRVLQLKKWFRYLDDKFAALEIGHGFALYEHLVRVPLIIAGPGVPKTLVGDQVRHVDLYPTLLELAGVEVPAGIDGRSVTPLLRGEELPQEPAYMEAVGVKLEGNSIAGARTPDWKYLRQGDGKRNLYSLGGQPDEKHNVFARYPEIGQELEAFVDRVRASQTEQGSGMTSEEEAVVEQHLRDLGYL